MAHLDVIPPLVLEKVATEIGNVVSQTLDENPVADPVAGGGLIESDGELTPPASSLRLAETLTVWKLKPEAFDALAESTIKGDLVNWVERTPSLYHQIKLDASPQGCARSVQTDSDDSVTLSDVNASTIAPRIDHLFKLIERCEIEDSESAYDPVVRLLEIPPYHVFALWLFDESSRESQVAIIDAPIREEALKPETFLTSEEFFRALAIAAPIAGVARKPASESVSK